MKRFTFSAASIILSVSAYACAQNTVSAAIAQDHRVVLPLVLRHGFPMVEGEVNGRKGYFMFDTGTAYSIFLNNEYAPLASGEPLKGGAVGSGQKIHISRYGCLKSLSFAERYTLVNLCGLGGADFKFVADELEPKLLGFLGYEVMRPYRMTLDLQHQHALLTDRSLPIEDGAVAVVHFAAEDRQVPRFQVTVGDISIAGKMDSGDPGHIVLTQHDADYLLAAGRLIRQAKEAGETSLVLNELSVGGSALNSVELPVSISGDRSEVSLGFLFLQHYRSVWDYVDHSVRLYTFGNTNTQKQDMALPWSR